ncbi:MAG: hypothetical protein LBR62_03075 [Puniceicoccales bacterium]|nr:hypothetical protein [Puniceicoccales bacterium]
MKGRKFFYNLLMISVFSFFRRKVSMTAAWLLLRLLEGNGGRQTECE